MIEDDDVIEVDVGTVGVAVVVVVVVVAAIVALCVFSKGCDVVVEAVCDGTIFPVDDDDEQRCSFDRERDRDFVFERFSFLFFSLRSLSRRL